MPLWFLVLVSIVVVPVALCVRRTHVYRQRRGGHGGNPAHMDYDAERYRVVRADPGPSSIRPTDEGRGGGLA